MFADGFPRSIRQEYENVISFICTVCTGTVNSVSPCVSDEEYLLSDGACIRFPYRIYFTDKTDEGSAYDSMTATEKMILDCIFTRSCDGYVREKHLRNLLNNGLPEWCMPYILRLSSEYVVEIIELIYNSLHGKDNTLMQMFCLNNPKILKCAYQRMISYWNVYYRERYPEPDSYVGRKLFRECFAPDINFKRL